MLMASSRSRIWCRSSISPSRAIVCSRWLIFRRLSPGTVPVIDHIRLHIGNGDPDIRATEIHGGHAAVLAVNAHQARAAAHVGGHRARFRSARSRPMRSFHIFGNTGSAERQHACQLAAREQIMLPELRQDQTMIGVFHIALFAAHCFHHGSPHILYMYHNNSRCKTAEWQFCVYYSTSASERKCFPETLEIYGQPGKRQA